MIQIDGQKFQESILAGSCHCVTSVIRIGPGIRSGRKTTIGQQIEDTFVWKLLGTKENEMLQGMREAIVIVSLSC